MLSDRIQAIEATINEELNRMAPPLPNPRLRIDPRSDSDGHSTRMGVQAMQTANQVLLARALEDD